jgi:hypothetical protein
MLRLPNGDMLYSTWNNNKMNTHSIFITSLPALVQYQATGGNLTVQCEIRWKNLMKEKKYISGILTFADGKKKDIYLYEDKVIIPGVLDN